MMAARGYVVLLLLVLLSLITACQPGIAPTVPPTPSPFPEPSRPLPTRTSTPRPPGLFVEPDDGVTPVLALIQGARRSLDVTVYLMTSREVMRALSSAARRGVAVRVILERHPYGGSESNQRAAAELQKSGVDVRYSSPAFRYTHQKSIVVDHRVGAILTMNFTHSSFTRNREYGVIVHDPVYVEEMERVFDADWARLPPRWPSPPRLVWSPVNSREVILHLIRSARTSLDLEEQDLVDEEVVQALIAAAQRGVRVRLVRPPLRDNEEVEQRNVRRLQRAGGQVRVVTSPYVHAKVIVVDQKAALVGSMNLTPTSLDMNRELGIVVREASVVHRILQVLQRDWEKGHAP